MGSAEHQKEIYTSQNDYSGLVNSEDHPRIKQIHNSLRRNLRKGDRLLDVGCAEGNITKDFTKIAEVYGTDISEVFLKSAAKNGLKVKKANFEEGLPFKDNFFDEALLSEVIEHVVDTDKLLSEINRVLKKEGRLIITIPNVNSLISYPMMLFFDLPPYLSSRYKGPHVRDFTLRTIKIALRENGFKIKNFTGCSFFIPPFRNMGKLGELLGRIFPRFSKVIILEAKKERNVEYNKNKAFSLKIY